jgi:hypothetical protein
MLYIRKRMLTTGGYVTVIYFSHTIRFIGEFAFAWFFFYSVQDKFLLPKKKESSEKKRKRIAIYSGLLFGLTTTITDIITHFM